jgi:hypothetical protein
MKNIVLSALIAVGAFALPGVASADDNEARSDAIRLCRAEIVSQTGLEASDVRLDQLRVRPRSVRVDFDVWRNGELENVRCEVERSAGELTLASISPALQAAAATPVAAAQ